MTLYKSPLSTLILYGEGNCGCDRNVISLKGKVYVVGHREVGLVFSTEMPH